MNFDLRGTLERHVTGRLPITLGGELAKIPLARAIYKGCDAKRDEPPKSKHIRHILTDPSIHRVVESCVVALCVVLPC